MNELPAYANVLLERKLSKTSPVKSPIKVGSLESVDSGSETRYDEIIQDLRAQLDCLRAENSEIDTIRNDIQLEEDLSAGYQAQILSMEEKMRETKKTAESLTDQLQQLELQLASKRSLAADKEKLLHQMQIDYDLLSQDYQRLLDRSQSIYSDPPSHLPPMPQMNFDIPEDSPAPEFFHDEPPCQPPSIETIKPALVDNIFFGEVEDTSLPIGDSLPALRAEYARLMREKDELRIKIQKKAAPGVSMSRANRERREWEQTLDDTEKRMSRIRLTIKQMGASLF